jgi:hypothetical protein
MAMAYLAWALFFRRLTHHLRPPLRRFLSKTDLWHLPGHFRAIVCLLRPRNSEVLVLPGPTI